MRYLVSVAGKNSKEVEGSDASDLLHAAAAELGYTGSLHTHLVDATGEVRGYTDDAWAAARRELPRETEDPEELPKFTYADDGKLALVIATPI